MPPPPPAPVPLFPAAPAIKLVTNAKLDGALKAAITAITSTPTPPPPFCLTIVDLESAAAGSNDFGSATYNPNVEHYAASMLKVACLYAAHALRDLVQRFARARNPKNPHSLFAQLAAEMDPLIRVCCPMVNSNPSPKQDLVLPLLPRWHDVFTAAGSGGGISVKFTSSYTSSLEQMIVPSNNAHAGRCIRGVGYAYLNGLMLKHGFFDGSAANKTGVWLAGDYSGSHVVTIPCVNDRDTKQGTTSEAMARLGTVILKGNVLPGASHGEMTELLKKSASGSDSSYFTRPEVQGHLTNAEVTHGKIGYGPLKTNRIVYSDLNAISAPIHHGGRFLVCYTNVDYHPYALDHVLRAFLEAVRVYQTVPAATPAAGAATAPGPVAPGAAARP